MLRPNLPEGMHKINPFKKIYKLDEFFYLDSIEASPLFKKQAELIIQHGYKNIIDVGCRTGPINDILNLYGYDYLYMGFDTSPEPIEYAQKKWYGCQNIEYRIADWYDYENIKVDFEVDCVLFSGVLCYLPDSHADLFHKLTVDIYQAEGAIIQDLRSDQVYIDERIELEYIYSELKKYRNKYHNVTEYKFNCNFYYGNRSIFDVRIYES